MCAFMHGTYLCAAMKKIIVLLIVFNFSFLISHAQGCSMCTKTAEQLGEKPAKALNTAIVYLMLTPLALIGGVGYMWWRREKKLNG